MSAASVSATALGGWVAVALVLGLLAGVILGRALPGSARSPHTRDRASGPAPTTDRPAGAALSADTAGPGARRVLEVDDLPAFLEHPPGSPPPGRPAAGAAAPAAPTPPSPAPAGGATAAGSAPTTTGSGRPAGEAVSARRTVLAMVAAAAVLVAVAVLIALVSGGGPTRDTPVRSAPAGSGPAEVPAGALASRSVPLGEEGMTARATFGSVLLEEWAVGVTVTRPALSVSTDGERALAHLRLPTFNCLARRPPGDPASAGCARGATELADLTGPALRVTRDGDRLQLTGRFPTYTRVPGRPATYTGRSYRLSATLAADGPIRDGRARATGVLRLGPASARTTGVPGLDVLQVRG